ncbi:MAG: hypothetical protein ACJAVK_001570 [Akkermansiaceae bacterium]|jgi:hypothetical protein
MKRLILVLGLLAMVAPAHSQEIGAAQLVGHLRTVYDSWRTAMVRKDAASWKRFTSQTKQTDVRNRLWSERRPFPDAVFASPVAPPDIATLKVMAMRVLGQTAKAVYFGKVDFGVGGDPTDNLFVISFVQEGQGWKYHGGEFVNLGALPDVRKQLQADDKTFLDSEDYQPDGVVEPAPIAIRGPVKYIAKAYVYCPGREVKLLVNNTSTHLFQNTKRADIVIGGAKDGLNEMQFAIEDIPGGDPQAPITLRIYLMSEVDGTKPLKSLEYQIEDGAKPKASGTLRFTVTPEMATQLKGR